MSKQPNPPKRVHVIACGVLATDLKAVAAETGLDVSFEFLPGGLHNTPKELRRRLQEAIDTASAEQRGDMIAVGYGVCGLGTVGLHARSVPLSIPRVHDCIALFLGSDAAYKDEFGKYPGTYYVSAGWVDERTQPLSSERAKSGDQEPTDEEFGRLVEKYGRENTDAIRQFFNSWQRNYQRAAFIDTGVEGRQGRRYAEIAQAMAKEFGWRYEELKGDNDLLVRLIKQRSSSAEILVVPPHHVTAYDALSKGLKAVPIWEVDGDTQDQPSAIVVEGEDPAAAESPLPPVELGLGIDAGGTYTDAVLFDFDRDATVQKAKALTTRWEYAAGISEALSRLDPAQLQRVNLVSLSTTLATNAIVEGRGQKVGLLLMPPYGRFDSTNFTHSPIAVIAGQMEIDGTELVPVDPEQVRRAVQRMREQDITAFAVTGYASHNNPSHELLVKSLIKEQTDATVTCGHDISEGLNYRVRAETAALNARIIPCLESLLAHVEVALEQHGVAAPVMVVKSDGSLMSIRSALQRPIETILSGPAASVAGARHLARRRDAIVVDVGGTTTDTALIRNGAVHTCRDGATVGGWKTHVQALDMRTTGLGGDSLVAIERGRIAVGPRRVAPVAWMTSRHPNTTRALDWLEGHLDYYDMTTRGMDLVALNGRHDALPLSPQEQLIVDALRDGPLCVHELATRVESVSWRLLALRRLEELHVVQRCGLTPTDLLHTDGQVALWDAGAAQRVCTMFGTLLHMDPGEFAEQVIRQVVCSLALEILKKQLDDELDADAIETSPPAMALVERALGAEADGLKVSLALDRPVIGIGAPVHCFLPPAAALLHTEAIVPPHADVANAIGAITSSVYIHKQVKLTVDDRGRYLVAGLADSPTFREFDEAQAFAVEYLTGVVREMAREAGTSQTRIEVVIHDQIGDLADGSRLFLGRTLEARLTGRPDLSRLTDGAGIVPDSAPAEAAPGRNR